MTTRALLEQKKQTTRELRRLLGDVDVDDHGVETQGLIWLYPQVKLWPTVRSVGGAGGSGGSSAPFNVEALDFIGGKYWTGAMALNLDGRPKSQNAANPGELLDDDNYDTGFEPTIIGLAGAVAHTLKIPDPPRLPGDSDPLKVIPSVAAALQWLFDRAPEIADDWFLTKAVRDEAQRLIARASSMMLGSNIGAIRDRCPKCHQPDTVVSDEDRAVCINPICRNRNGGRHCWRWADVGNGPEWIEVAEPNVRGRGQVSDDKLSRWAETG